ncbi:hypothetical protein [Paenibacillus sp. NPDC055715]
MFNKKMVLLTTAVLAFGIVVAGCGNASSKQTEVENKAETASAPVKKEEAKTITADEVVAKFKAAGLEAENTREMKPKDYGPLPMKAKSATVFYLPSIGEKNNGHVFVFDNKEDLQELKKRYEDMGKESAMFFSYLYEKDNILLHMTGQAKEEQFKKYQDVIDTL